MGGAHSREDSYHDANAETPGKSTTPSSSVSSRRPKTPSSLEEVESRLQALKLKNPSSSSSSAAQNVNPNLKNAVKLYLHIGGNTPKAKWVTSEKVTSYEFLKTSGINTQDEEEEEEEDEGDDDGESWWFLKVSNKIGVKVSSEMQLKTFKEQRRVDFVANGVWAMKFFVMRIVKVYGKDFIGWANPEKADDSMWEDAEDSFLKSPGSASTPLRENRDLREEFEEAANGGIQSLALGALDNSFLVGDSGIQVVKNFSHGIHGKGVFVNFSGGNRRSGGSNLMHSTPKKALLMRA
ncbi:hypothetical protein Tsubulata_048545 [Turnera subulata]|uniref:DUF7135 domain-containing protein n=1 Tax=Turnera subulata TaxID=218843 RepID=A0A9Q0FI36_9ROSI|nr:hypothetical protein Tsubulata_048545 [Turnera subulata]